MNYLPLNYEWIMDENSFEFNIHLEKIKGVPTKDFKGQIEIFKNISNPSDWSNFNWQHNYDNGKSLDKKYTFSRNFGPLEIVEEMMKDFIIAFNHFNPLFIENQDAFILKESKKKLNSY